MSTMVTSLPKFRVAKHVTLPLLKMDDSGKPAYVKITGKIFKAEDTAARRLSEGQQAMAPPELAHVINLENGEHAQIIVPAVLGAELRKAYPSDSYVDKNFEIKKFKVAGGRRYSTFQIAEIELETESKPAPVAGRKSA